MNAPCALSTSAKRVQAALTAAGLECRVVEHAASARTSAEAAQVLGCAVAQIAKSLVFRVEATGDPDFVRAVTGYAIGGIPPLGHAQPIRTFVDRTLLDHDVVYAAGGTPNALFAIRPQDLVRVSGGRVADTCP